MKKFDLTSVYHKDRPFSWSAKSSFDWNPRQWYEKYVLKLTPEETPELRFGKMVDQKIQDDPTFLPHVVRYPIFQHKMEAIYKGIPLVGLSDAYSPPQKIPKFGEKGYVTTFPELRDYKTGRKPWDQKRADQTGQLTLYVGMHYLQDKIRPEDFKLYIDWLPTHYVNKEIAFIEPDHTKLVPKTFQTKRTMLQVLAFLQSIEDTWAKMQEYGERQARLDPEDMSDW